MIVSITSDGTSSPFGKGLTNIVSQFKTAQNDFDILNKIMQSAQSSGKDVAEVVDNMRDAYDKLSPATKKLADDAQKSNTEFIDLIKKINATTFASKAASVGMKALSVAMNVGIDYRKFI